MCYPCYADCSPVYTIIMEGENIDRRINQTGSCLADISAWMSSYMTISNKKTTELVIFR